MLRRDVRNLQLEHDLLKKANELLKKGLGVDLQLLTNREKTLLVDALRQTHALPDLLTRLSLARSSYFYHRARLWVADKYGEVRRTIADMFERNHRCYGYRRIHASLSRQHVSISEKVVQRLMKQERSIVATKKRRPYGSYLGEISPAPENLINRDFQAAAPNEKWLTDITEFQLPAGKVYLSPMIDCFDGLVVSWTIGTRPDAELVNTMLDAAVETVADSEHRPVVHSDRGAHYRWPGWLARIGDARLIRSMSRKGCSPDNAACEGFFGRLKTELFYPRQWQATTIEQFIQVLDAYIRWYNEKRIKISLGSLSPLEYRERASDLPHNPVQDFGRTPQYKAAGFLPAAPWSRPPSTGPAGFTSRRTTAALSNFPSSRPRVWPAPRRRTCSRSKSPPRAWACIGPSSMRTCTCWRW